MLHRCCRPSGYIMKNRILDHHQCGSFNSGNTYNINFNCNGNRANFWTGCAAALGFNVGNFLGGFMGNMGGFGMGGFGMGGFGMPGFGFGGFGMGGFGMPGLSFGNWGWGGAGSGTSNTGTSSTTSTTSGTSCNCANIQNLDHAELNTLSRGVDKLLKSVNGAPTEEQTKKAKEFYDKLKNYTLKDKVNDADDKTSIENILARLTGKFPNLGNTNNTPAAPNGDNSGNSAGSSNGSSNAGGSPGAGSSPSGNADGTQGSSSGTTPPSSGNAFQGYEQDIEDIGNLNITYLEGYTNYTEADLEDLKKNGVIRAHDKEGYPRITDIGGEKRDPEKSYVSPNGQTIKIGHKGNLNKTIIYTYIGKTTDGEYIYMDITAGVNKKQYYILQKNNNGEFEFIQYKGMPGSTEKAHS